MADSKISALSAQTTLASTDMLVVANSGSTTKKITGASLLTQMPGYEIGYDQITSSVPVVSTTESSGTTIISCAAHTFDGGPVIAEFFTPFCDVNNDNNKTLFVCLFESTTEIGRLCAMETTNNAALEWVPLIGKLRFTPTAASHTYTVTASIPGTGSSSGGITAGAGGTAAYVPAYIRFTKV